MDPLRAGGRADLTGNDRLEMDARLALQPVNWVLQPLHIVGKDTWPMWFGERDLAMAPVIAVHVWRLLPFATVIIHLDPPRGQRGRRSRRRRLLVAQDPHRPAAPAADPHRGR